MEEKVIIKLTFKAGSENQMRIFNVVLGSFLQAMRSYLERSHSKNKFSYEYKTDNGDIVRSY
jgi:hypothetical protein